MGMSFRNCWRESKDFDRLKPALRTKSKSSQLPELVEETCANNFLVGCAVLGTPQCQRRVVGQFKRKNCIVRQLGGLLRITGSAFLRESEPAIKHHIALRI